MEVVHKVYTSIVNRIFGYLEYILLNGRGNIIPLSATTTAFSMTALKPAEGIIEIDKNETSRKMYHYLNNDCSSGISNRFKKKEILQKKINLEFGNTEPARYNNDTEVLKTAMKSNGLYHGIFYENMVGYCSSKIVLIIN